MTLWRYAFLLGFALWLVATAIFVPFGHYLLGPGALVPEWLTVAIADGLTFAALYLVAPGMMRRFGSPSFERAAALGACLALPGLIGDALLYVLGGGRYPGLDAPASGTMSIALLFAYAAVLAATLAAGARRADTIPARTDA